MNGEPAKIFSELFESLILREFGEFSNEVTGRLLQVNSDSESGRRRISTAILRLTNKNIDRLEQLLQRANSAFRHIIAEVDYPRVFEAGFSQCTFY